MERIEFLSALLPGSAGLVRLVAGVFSQTKEGNQWKEEWIQWGAPDFEGKLEAFVQMYDGKLDLGFSPVLYASPSSKKSSVIAGACMWADLDKGIPKLGFPVLGEPSILVNTSNGKYHAYWMTDEPDDWVQLEEGNKAIATELKDDSGWQINKVLRLPGTWSKKNGCRVEIVQNPLHKVAIPKYNPKAIVTGKKIDKPVVGNDTQIMITLSQYKKIPRRVVEMIVGEPLDEETDRSEQLWYLTNALKEAKVSPKDTSMFVMYVAKKCGKFFEPGNERPEEITNLVNKAWSGVRPSGPDPSTAAPRGIIDLIQAAPPEMPWIMRPLLHENGFFLIGGESNIGKSQLMMNLGIQLTLQGSFLGWDFSGSKQEKILLIQAEMGDNISADLYRTMLQGKEEEELVRLNEYMHQWTTEGSVFLNDAENAAAVERTITDGKYTGVIFDSLSAFAPGMVDDKDIRPVIEFLDKLRYGIGAPWVGVVSHPRKMPAGVKAKAEELNDIIGSIVVQQRLDSAFMLIPSPSADEEDGSRHIKVRHIKARSTPHMEDFYVRRTGKLGYEVVEELKGAKPIGIKKVGKDSPSNQTSGKWGL